MNEIPTTVETVGTIDLVSREGNEVIVLGWVAAAAGDPVDAVSARFAGSPAVRVAVESGIPSPDVEQAHPHLVSAGRARFRVTSVGDAATPPPGADALVAIKPWVRGRAGRTLFAVLEPSLPPPSEENLAAVGGGMHVAFEFLGHLVDLAGLTPGDRFLEIGCGTGRIAYALAYYLEQGTRYDGFDVRDDLVRWASAEITPRHPNFTFRVVDVGNGAYRPHGAATASSLVFPYTEGCFDVALLASVFTHMRSADVRHYLAEIRRVLRPGGRVLLTCWLLDAESRRAMAESRCPLRFEPLDDLYTADRDVPERAIAFDRDRFLGWIADAGFTLRSEHTGWWSGRRGHTSFQDVLVLEAPVRSP